MKRERRALIAIADDDVSIRTSMSRLLRTAGLEVSSYASGLELIDGCAVAQPDCILIDWQMPGLAGADLCRQLACSGVTAPLLVVTACNDLSVQTTCSKLAVSGVLLKPVDPVTLLTAIAAALDTGRVAR